MMNAMIGLHIPLSPLFARGGGGGSGGGGGDGGGFIFLIGYLPMHFLGAKFKNRLTKVLGTVILWPLALIYAGILTRVGGGYGFVAGIGALVGTGAGLYGWFDKVLKRNKKAKKLLDQAAAMDPAWHPETITARANDVFMRYQADWSANNAVAMQPYMTEWYFYHARLMVLALAQLKRQDNVINPKIMRSMIVDIQDDGNDANDSFTMYFQAAADDQLIDQTSQKVLFRDKKPFEEYWKFQRVGNEWMLAGIEQQTANAYKASAELQAFAKAHNYCYSLDWGWLLLPQRGQLFGKANFGKSDINNHVIGVYNNTLIQLYNYLPAAAKEKKNNYLIAQVAVPKTYGNIVVRKKRKLPFGRIKGLTKVQTEWNDFNIRYEVWASDMERVTSFELLNPSYMVQLQELPFEVNIEVVDNIVYLYSAKITANSANYAILLDVLYKAFKEMRM